MYGMGNAGRPVTCAKLLQYGAMGRLDWGHSGSTAPAMKGLTRGTHIGKPVDACTVGLSVSGVNRGSKPTSSTQLALPAHPPMGAWLLPKRPIVSLRRTRVVPGGTGLGQV